VADPAKSASACEATHSSARDALVGPHNSYFPFVIHVDGGEEEENPLADERRGEEEEEYLFEEEETGRVEKNAKGTGQMAPCEGRGALVARSRWHRRVERSPPSVDGWPAPVITTGGMPMRSESS
jgi:hypothetical protein